MIILTNVDITKDLDKKAAHILWTCGWAGLALRGITTIEYGNPIVGAVELGVSAAAIYFGNKHMDE